MSFHVNRRFGKPETFAAFLRTQLPHVAAAIRAGLDHAGEVVETNAKARIGHEQEGWPALAERTVEDRTKKGFSPNEPLYRTGGLRDSIGHHVSGNSVEVGSSDKKAAWQEFGTSRIPPRPFIGAAMAEALPEAAHAAMGPVVDVLGGSLPSVHLGRPKPTSEG